MFFLLFAVVGMAQDFVGSNNVNLLIPSGQFGTRLNGGSDAASPRYIFTYLSPITRLIFPEVDEVLLTHCEDDGQVIEPYFYCPVIPMLLVNGCQGIGTGWSSSIPSFHPIDVLNYIRAKLNETELPKIRPYARGFNGTIETLPSDRGYVSVGRAKKLNGKTIEIDELPLSRWTTTYKAFLSELEQNGVISNVYENHTTTKVSFKVTVESSHQETIENRESMYSVFKLRKRLSTSNMHAFDATGVIRQYRTPEEIANDFFPVRMNLYEDRKSVMESETEYLALLARNKAKFIQTVTENGIDLLRGRKSKQDLICRLNELGFSNISSLRTVRNNNEPFRRKKLATFDVGGIKAGEFDSDNDGLGEYDYLLNMPLSSLTAEKFSGLQDEASLLDKELERTKATTAADLWRQDLDKLDPKLQEFITS
jgi:DNA topoisomerase II